MRTHITHKIYLTLLALPLLGAGCQSPPKTVSPAPAPSETLAPGLFADVTEKAGIAFRHTNGSETRYLFLQTIGGGGAFLDYDDDGDLDILLASSGEFPPPANPATPTLALYRNNGDSTFTDVTPGSGLDGPVGYAQAVATGDYDNDGFPDVFIAGYGSSHLFRNVVGTPRRFQEVTQDAGMQSLQKNTRWATGAAWGDYDNDGKLDLAICHYALWTPETNKECPRPDGSPGYCVPTVYPGDTVQLWHNEGNGRFRDVTQATGLDKKAGRGLAIAWLDFNDDGRDDLYIANDLDPNALWRNTPNGTFTEVGAEMGVAYGANGGAASGMGIALGDYNRTGRESLLVANLHGEGYSLFQPEGGGLYTYVSHRTGLYGATQLHSGWGIAFGDFDRDGWPDVLASNGSVHERLVADLAGLSYQEPMGLYRNTGQGTFVDMAAEAGDINRRRAGRGLALGDFDNDGRLDALAINRNDRADLFHNVSADTHHWVSLRLVGTQSNRDAAGAKVMLTVNGQRLFGVCRLGGSYASTSDKRLHFGLGTATKIDSVEVRWPRGRRDLYRNLDANAFYIVTEGKGYARDTRIGSSRP